MSKEMFGKSLRNYICKEGYTKSSFAKMLGMSYKELDLIISNNLSNYEVYKKNISKILETINMDVNSLIEKYYSEDTCVYSNDSQESKKYKEELRLNEEQKEIIIDLIEDKIREISSTKNEIQMQGNKEWRVLDLESEIENLKNIKNIISNITIDK